jgi:hypothetical protein
MIVRRMRPENNAMERLVGISVATACVAVMAVWCLLLLWTASWVLAVV